MSLAHFFAWLEHSWLGASVRSLGVWSYGVINLVHILGIILLFGSILILDLRLLGAWRQIPLATLSQPTTRMAQIGFVLAVASGIPMLSVKTTDYIGNPFLLIKFPAIFLGVVNVAILSRLPAWKARETREVTESEQRVLSVFGAISLLSWLTAIGAGRLIGYW